MATNGVVPITGAQQDAILKQDAEQNRAPVHTFDPDTPPRQKAAAAGKGREQLQSIVADDKKRPATTEKGV